MITFTELGKKGRLGNQLFQIAATIDLALRNDSEYGFPRWPEEINFNLHGCFYENFSPRPTYREPHFEYSEIPYQPELDITGFFQSEKYFDESKHIVRSLLTPKLGFGIKYNHTSIHVRRGDYVNNQQNYVQLGMDYYNQAINLTNSNRYIVFSDDIEWCKGHFKGDKFSFAEGNAPAHDLALMLACEHNIIANSSFSWWGAYLNKNPGKTVIAPKKWFGPQLQHNTKDLLPPEWMTI